MQLISVIITVFKADQYISRFVDSILAQKFTGFELDSRGRRALE